MPSKIGKWWACGGGEGGKKKKRKTGGWKEARGRSGAKRSLFEWLVNGGVGVQAGGIGVHELGGVMRCHGRHAAGVS